MPTLRFPECPTPEYETNERAWRAHAESLRLRLAILEDGRAVVRCGRGGYLWGWGHGRYAWSLPDGKRLTLPAACVRVGPGVYAFPADKLPELAAEARARYRRAPRVLTEDQKLELANRLPKRPRRMGGLPNQVASQK